MIGKATTIQIQAAQSATGNIKRRLDEQLSIINGYSRFIVQLQENWSGGGYRSFVRTYEQLSPKVKENLENMSLYNNEIIKLLNEMQAVDTRCATLFENV